MAALLAMITYCAICILITGALSVIVQIALDLRDAWGEDDEDDEEPTL